MGAANSRAAEKSGAAVAAETSSGDENGENNSQAEDEPGDEDEGLKMSFHRGRRRRVSIQPFNISASPVQV